MLHGIGYNADRLSAAGRSAMPSRSACPDAEALRRLALGQLAEEQAQGLEAHLLECEACVGALRRVADHEPLTQALRGEAAGADVPHGPEVENLIHHLRHVVAHASPGPADSTLSPPTPRPGEPADLAPPGAPGELGRLGPYRVLRVLGRGGMAEVYAALDPQLERPVALKVLRPEVATDPEYRERFLREARATAALTSDHVVTVYQVGEDRGILYLAMPLLAGETLQDRLDREGPLPAVEVVRIGREIAEGLAAAHARGLVHRDVKPSNVWLETSGSAGQAPRVKILDFGLAHRLQADVRLTQSGCVLGTPAFMAPEQARGVAAEARSDLYSLGVVLYALATGRLPFEHKDPLALVAALLTDPPPAVGTLRPDLPPDLAALMMRLLAKRPEDRPPSARAVVEALGAVDTGTPARPRRRPWLVVGLAAALLAAVALAAIPFRARKGPEAQAGPTQVAEERPATAPTPPPAAAAVGAEFRELHGADRQGLQAWLNGLAGAGYRLTFLSAHAHEGPPRFNALAVRDEKAAPPDVNFARGLEGVFAQAQAERKKGLGPLLEMPYRDNEQLWFVGVWSRETPKGWVWRHRRESVQRKMEVDLRAEARPVFLAATLLPIGELYYSCVAVSDRNPDWQLVFDQPAADLPRLLEEQRRKGWRPDCLTACWDGKQVRYQLIVVENKDGTEWLYQTGLSAADYEANLARQAQLGWRPHAVASSGDPAAPRYAVVWVRAAAGDRSPQRD
jgi:Protein kinase domain/Bacterial tandem repeat domain 1